MVRVRQIHRAMSHHISFVQCHESDLTIWFLNADVYSKRYFEGISTNWSRDSQLLACNQWLVWAISHVTFWRLGINDTSHEACLKTVIAWKTCHHRQLPLQSLGRLVIDCNGSAQPLNDISSNTVTGASAISVFQLQTVSTQCRCPWSSLSIASSRPSPGSAGTLQWYSI